jgi:hypothetical protein
VLEACAAGIGVVGSDIPGMIEVAGHFADIHCLPLVASAAVWADAAEAVRREIALRSTPMDATRIFARTPFGMAAANDAYMALLALAIREHRPLVGMSAAS